MKKWLKSEFNDVKQSLKKSLQLVEKNLWANIPFTY